MKRSFLVAGALLCSCVADTGEELGTTSAALTVDREIAKASCSTSSSVMKGLSDQILDEISKCLKPGVLVKVSPEAKLAISSGSNAYMVKPAYDALKASFAKGP